MYNHILSECELTCITLSISGAEFLHSRTVPFCVNTRKHASTMYV